MTLTDEFVTRIGGTLRLIDVLRVSVKLLCFSSKLLLRVTIELFSVTDKLSMAVELTCVTLELNVISTVLLFDETKRVIVVTLRCVT